MKGQSIKCPPCKHGQSTTPGHTDYCGLAHKKCRELKRCPLEIKVVATDEDMAEIIRRADDGDPVAMFLLGWDLV